MRTVSSGVLTTMTAEHLPCGTKNVIPKDWLARMIYAGNRTHVFTSRRQFEPTTRGLGQKPDSIFKNKIYYIFARDYPRDYIIVQNIGIMMMIVLIISMHNVI